MTSHARHDRFAIAASIGGEPRPSTLGTCPGCGALHRDLLAIRSAIRHAWTPSRPRPVLLTAADAARLDRAWWRQLLEAVTAPHDMVTRPLAASLSVLGLAGLLLTVVPVGAPQAARPASVEAMTQMVDVAGRSPAPTDARPASSPLDSAAGIPPLMVLSGGLLGAGTGLFVARRVINGRRAVR